MPLLHISFFLRKWRQFSQSDSRMFTRIQRYRKRERGKNDGSFSHDAKSIRKFLGQFPRADYFLSLLFGSRSMRKSVGIYFFLRTHIIQSAARWLSDFSGNGMPSIIFARPLNTTAYVHNNRRLDFLGLRLRQTGRPRRF